MDGGFSPEIDAEAIEDPDRELMVRVRDGDGDAFRLLHERHSRALVRYATGMTGAPARAEELVQDVFLQAYRARERWEPTAKVSTWLYTIAHNLCINEVRKFEYRHKSRIEPLERSIDGEEPRAFDRPDPAALDGEAMVVALELEERVRSLVAGLPEAQRSALVLSRTEDLRYQEIGEILNCSEQAVKSLVFRATKTLREGLKEYLEG